MSALTGINKRPSLRNPLGSDAPPSTLKKGGAGGNAHGTFKDGRLFIPTRNKKVFFPVVPVCVFVACCLVVVCVCVSMFVCSYPQADQFLKGSRSKSLA